jgi:hypothetical protein
MRQTVGDGKLIDVCCETLSNSKSLISKSLISKSFDHIVDTEPMTKRLKEAERLRKIIEAFPKVTITVLGDLVADEFVYGEISRVSREAPVLILKHRERTVVPGGGANAVNNLADLGVNVLPVGAIGDDEPGRMLLKIFRHKRIPVSGVIKDKSYTTVTKTRILAGMTHNTRQQVVRGTRIS